MAQRNLNPNLEVEGVLLTMLDSRTKLGFEVVEEIRKYFKERVYNVSIPKSVKVPVAQSKGKPINHYDKNCSVSKAYGMIAEELIKNDGKARNNKKTK